MGTPISSLAETRTLDLCTDFPEDRELEHKIRNVVSVVIAQLKPILKYVTSPVRVECISPEVCRGDGVDFSRVVVVSKENAKNFPIYLSGLRNLNTEVVLFLHDNGAFILAVKCTECREEHYFVRDAQGMFNCDGPTWEYFRFGEVFKGLRRTLQNAVEKRRAHLTSIEERVRKLDVILAELQK